MFFVCSKRGHVYPTYTNKSEPLENIFINVFIKIKLSPNSPFIALLSNLTS